MSWFERLHPRRPDGEFINKDTWASGLASKIGGHFHHKAGSDQRGKVLKDRKSRALYTQNGFDPHRGDDGLARIARLHGWDAPARTGSEADLDAAIADGGLELWRGVHSRIRNDGQPIPGWKRGQPTAVEMLARERTGELRYGYGIYGNGMYVSADRRVANAYGTHAETASGSLAEIQESPADLDSIQRMVLSPHARVVRYRSPEWDAVTGDPDYPEMNQLMAAGVDAVYVEGQSQRGGDGTRFDADQYIILNRTAVLYEAP